jgi:lipid-A-disaccharide synthase
MPPSDDAPIMIVAGEASGDLHGATLCRALRSLAPGRRLVGMGGERMAAAGVERAADVTAAAVIGGTEALGPLATLYRAWRRLTAVLHGQSRPAVVVVIDFPEFNLRLARVARRAGIPVVYFIPPQVWAWRPWRIRAIRRRVSRVLAVLPFEVALYESAGVPVAFVGHPVLDAVAEAPSREEARRKLAVPPDAIVLGLLPGSRAQEIAYTLPVLRAAANRIVERRPGARLVLALAPSVDRARVERLTAGTPPVTIVPDAHVVMRAADLLLVTSGTATLEAALLGTPMIVCYRFSRLSEAWVRLLVRVPWISLVNITLGRSVVPEIYQRAFTPEQVAAEAERLLGSPAALAAQRQGFAELRGLLGEPGVGERAAHHVLALAQC